MSISLRALRRLFPVCLLALNFQGSAADVSPVLQSGDDEATVIAKAAAVVPTPRQVAWQRREFIAFVHFGMNTFTGREWGEGTEDPKTFNPTAFDARQWVAACKAAGMTCMILTAKHHDGFCLWPSAFTEHSVKNSPWKDGKGDLVKEFVTACREAGMGIGIYLSPWDRHDPSYGDSDKYNQHFKDQLREVLTAYPDVCEVWFDGACGEGPNGKRQVYDWRGYWTLIRELVPNAAITVRGPDVRWCGNEAGHARINEWSVIPRHGGDADGWETSDATLKLFGQDAYGEDLGSRKVLMDQRNGSRLLWWPSQVNTSIRGGWFYHESEDGGVKSLEHLLNIYEGSVGGNAQFLLNIPPDKRGLFHENDVARLKELGDLLRKTFAVNLAKGATVTAQVANGSSIGQPKATVDGNLNTGWTTTDNAGESALMFDLGMAKTFNTAVLQEHLPSGQRIESFAIDVKTGGAWKEVAQGGTVGHKRLVHFRDVSAAQVRVRFLSCRVRPTLAEFGLYQATPILSAPKILRDLDGLVTITGPAGADVRFTTDGSLPTAQSPLYSKPFPLPLGGTIIARTLPATAGNGIAVGSGDPISRAEFGLAKKKWSILSVSSEDSHDVAKSAIDEKPNTIWHSKYKDGGAPGPHVIAIDLGEDVTATGIIYQPRQDLGATGTIATRVRVETSGDGTTWTIAVPDFRFDNIVNARTAQAVPFAKPIRCHAIRLTLLETSGDGRFGSAAEVGVVVGR